MNVKVIKTVKGRLPMQEETLSAITENTREMRLISIFPDIEYQEIKGFGGAFTEAASTTLDKLSKENREKIIKLYFDEKDGIGYNFGRVHINSCDFALGNYACVEENDETLETFNIDRDKKSLIPMIKEAQKYGDLCMLASPWSPPAYMKTNGQMNLGGKLKEEYYELWSEFYVKFAEEYKKEGIDIWAVTVQNEPKAVQNWDSCIYTAEEERDFVKNYLGQKMDEAGIKILFWDHNKERILDRARVMLSDEKARKYVHGMAFHWYSGDHFEQLRMFKELYPDMDLAFTEGCYEYSRGMLDTTKIGERYAHDMIGNFNNYCNIFCDWNMVLDEKGGPNHVENYCDAPIMADTVNNEIMVRDSYYYIGHFSKYIKKGAKRIGSSTYSKDLETVSFKNPDNTIVTIVMNTTEEDKVMYLHMGENTVETQAEARSISTYIFSEI